MPDQSHIDDMRAAIRGDLERARARRPSIFERPAVTPAAEVAEETEPVAVVAPDPAPDVAPAEVPTEPAHRRSFVARLFGRS
jgi:hypothetical protein